MMTTSDKLDYRRRPDRCPDLVNVNGLLVRCSANAEHPAGHSHAGSDYLDAEHTARAAGWRQREPHGVVTPFRVPVEDLRLPHNVVAGCNFLKLAAYTHQLRATTEDLEPVVVAGEPDGSWRITDGRHRFLAAVIAGRPDVLCVQTAVEAV